MSTLLDPAVLFFACGVLAGLLKSNLEIPAPISRFLSLYLLMALGLKGGFALARSGFTPEVVASLACAIALALIVPVLGYWLLKHRLSGFDAAALAATYGSVSAVTFVTAVQVVEARGLAPGGHMAAALAVMESPAILIAVILANALRQRQHAPAIAGTAVGAAVATGPGGAPSLPFRRIVHESFTDGAQVLLLAAMLIGLITGEAGRAAMQPFSGEIFKGMLAFFLLDMGLAVARNMPGLRGQPVWLLAYALFGPIVHAALALALAAAAGLTPGNAALLMVLAASASYIAVPAVLRYAIPEANPSLYLGMSLGVTFPFNILIGIALYTSVAEAVLG